MNPKLPSPSCPSCHLAVRSEDKFCGYCGNRVVVEDNEAQSPEPKAKDGFWQSRIRRIRSQWIPRLNAWVMESVVEVRRVRRRLDIERRANAKPTSTGTTFSPGTSCCGCFMMGCGGTGLIVGVIILFFLLLLLGQGRWPSGWYLWNLASKTVQIAKAIIRLITFIAVTAERYSIYRKPTHSLWLNGRDFSLWRTRGVDTPGGSFLQESS
jgi:uncharacterized Zn finger protein (UPF0148 family)